MENLTITQARKLLKEGKITSEALTKYYVDRIKKYKDKNAVLEVFDDALTQAKECDKQIKKGKDLPLLGVPILIKDNLLYEGKTTSCASKFLENYKAQYTATAVQKLLDAGAVILGRSNMDEFAMGSSTRNSAFGICKNAYDDTRVPGGSSGGSAVATALDLCVAALGSDTGGSIRQPASLNGVVGLKPSYGRVSRYGLIAFGSSLDQIGPITKTVEDAAILLKVMAGSDPKDQTSSQEKVDDYCALVGIKGKKIGIIKEVDQITKTLECYDKYKAVLEVLKQSGAEIVEVSVPNYKLSLPLYYIISPAEAASNLGRFDGIKYSRRSEKAGSVEDIYILSRTEGFGKEVKRRIMLGNFVLSSGYFDAYYVKAKRIQQQLIKDTEKAFEKCDVIMLPTALGEAFKLDSVMDPVEEYKEDMFTIFANLVGIPAISIPFAKGKANLPLGLQLMSKKFDEKTLISVADFVFRKYKGGGR
ncbi:MAG: Asp-tRNA(Asn)/Glu-tRNA(Gln) amidotransferase subunit GatA [Christensenellaceae bacterium]|jgi:aspartyl-tRNA(Asn)/glutamyl-tRNA(Gln) amidotransferase subunit A|nr:Asp-tRNA(Asn)/Glu-tRNA(Gln) amidotransferase subunit GatA [Christensenellaceae bacterium]